ncbi:MAG TPA: molecular chaperone DnaJ [Cellvibrionales bacterium]|nr:DnaJ domain-containing protein [Pseudomonadales bacterium]HAW14372.1 molecular chaperone DnaJ [Cellvibrionales bacterium]HCX26515.1 molecular chaperone DnaJ [Cellvibrionales bacterium]
MARIIILIAALGVTLFLWVWLKARYQEQGRPFAVKATLVACALILIGLAATGRVHWLGALLASALAGMRFLLPIIFKSLPLLAPFLKRAKAEQADNNSNANTANSSDMTKDEAFAILGLDHNATENEIVMAHRRLIQKLHPDTGGNEYLATQLNIAKAVLLK